MYKYHPQNAGAFQEKDCGVWFTYEKQVDSWAGTDFAIHMSDGSKRAAHIMKTRALVCIDEDSSGEPVFEKWILKKHEIYAHNA